MLFAGSVSAQQRPSERLQQLIERDWEAQLRANPLFATNLGDPRYNHLLDPVSPADFERQAAENRTLLEELRSIPRDSLSSDERINYDILVREKREAVEAAELNLHLIPITNRSGFHTYFPELPQNVPLGSTEDYENYIARLRVFREWTGDHIGLMREGIRAGMVLPSVSLKGIEETIQPHIVDDPTESLLWEPFASFPTGVPDSDRDRLAQAGRAAIEESVVPGYRDFLQFLQEEYVPAARPGIAASELPNGPALYSQRVRSYTTLDISPDEVHETGLREVARIRAEMDTLIHSTGFTGSFSDFLAFLRTDPQFYVDTPEELMARTALFLKQMDGELPRLFGRLPRMPYGIKPIPDYIAPRTTTAYYSRPAGDGTRAGFYWVNTYDLPSRPTYEIEALSYHEAVPGHHLQIALAQEIEGLPEFRRFGGFTAFVEGWALYAEQLGYDAGFFTDPYSRFGQLTYEMWRALRLVVDTGMHAKGWTRQQAIDYMAENSALTLLNITNEVDRYIAWPGQALAYKTGQMKISELRAEAERALGSQFDIRSFHDVVLGSGAVPLTVLEEIVRGWIAAEAGRGSNRTASEEGSDSNRTALGGGRGSGRAGQTPPRAYVDGTGPGWRELGESDFADVNGEPETWTWEEDLLRTTGRPIGVYRTEETFRNFEMVIEWRHLQAAGNSGVFLWTPAEALAGLEPDKLPESGIEVQILDHGFTEWYERETGRKGDWFTTNGDVFPVGEAQLTPFPPTSPNGSRSFPRKNLTRGTGEWNHYYIRAVNGEVRLWVNGEEVSGGNNAEPREGYICLEAEGAPVEFKNIRVRELP